MARDNWMFLQAFLKSPRVIASVFPSSSFLERRVVRAADVGSARAVVELGAGTGGITRTLLEAMGQDGRLIAIERTAAFVDGLGRIGDPAAAGALKGFVESNDSNPDALWTGIVRPVLLEAWSSRRADAR